MVQRLAASGAEFVLVGVYAAVAHGASVVTRDVDICCRFSPENLRRLAAALAEVHPKHRMTPQKLPLEIRDQNAGGMRNLYLETDLCALDCRSEIAGVGDFDEVMRQSIEIRTPAGNCRVLGLEALLRAKEAMGCPHDRITIVQLQAIKERLQASNPAP
jgi:hypothetical protein